ncbi:hypothetical protein [Parafrankia sp. BMG5.11]|uniref:hypothetical protein n=1 Tax=Parafrankia sp. BMG5.11 TaxID=222540 RepID=UPI00103FEF44|nr:hypothetical protein [Parafrankia sp. BMG5.11]TCJ37272.1 hypothetical protein E0504_19690 [Parafrankia sp. BMG5.11]
MLLRMATLGALGYAAYNYYNKNREQVDGTFRRLTQGGSASGRTGDNADLAGGPLSRDATVVHAGEGPLAPTS